MDEVAESGEALVITKNGRPVSRLVPYREKVSSLWGLHHDQVEMLDDLVEPTGESWEADR
jgi:antitoxin (DNA-binding transcriptional repressor) of toxin-antitoxin stability system